MFFSTVESVSQITKIVEIMGKKVIKRPIKSD